VTPVAAEAVVVCCYTKLLFCTYPRKILFQKEKSSMKKSHNLVNLCCESKVEYFSREVLRKKSIQVSRTHLHLLIHNKLNNADLLPPVVAMHAPCVIGLQDHAISSARDEESTSFACYNGKESLFVPMHALSCY
jgi:hypothetical protein